jgi:hypothetical protein
MEYDRTDLTDFFGALPRSQDPEEEEFFGSCAFEVERGPLTLRVSFSSTHSPKVIAELLQSSDGKPSVYVRVREAVSARVEASPRRLVVLAEARDAGGSDHRQEERLTVLLDPLQLRVSS